MRRSPTPKESTFAPCMSISRMMYSSRELDAQILQSSKPASSSIFLAFLERYVMSPLSMRMPAGRKPCGTSTSLKTRMAFGTPDFNTLYVSTSSVQLCGYSSAYALNASYSLSKSCTQLCAMVPSAGTPKRRSLMVQAVPTQPPIYAARAP